MSANRRNNARPPVLRRLRPALEVCERRELLVRFIPFDVNSIANGPNTEGVDRFSQATGIDFAVGNGLVDAGFRADGVTPANLGAGIMVGDTFTFHYQAAVTGVNVVGGQISPAGLDTLANGVRPAGSFELTAVATLRERVAAVILPSPGNPLPTAVFQLVDDPINSFRVFFDASGVPANNVTGLGFDDGTLIYEVTPSPSGYVSSFTNAGGPAPDVDPIGPNYTGVMSNIGSGVTNFSSTVVPGTVNPQFFLPDPASPRSLVSIDFVTSLSLPYSNTEASAVIGGITPEIGAINGFVGPDIISEVDANSSFVNAGIDLVKLTNGTDNDTAPGPVVPVGSTVTFTYTVTNTGGVALGSSRQPGGALNPLLNTAIVDDAGTPGIPGDDFSPTPVLAPGTAFNIGDANRNGLLDPDPDAAGPLTAETWTFTATRTATLGQYTNLGSVTALPPIGPPVSDTNPDNHFGGSPDIAIVKLTNGTNNDAAPGLFVPVGSPVTFTYSVTNPGNVALSNVTVTDDNGTPANATDDFSPTPVLAAGT
ncbi:MAG TPA: hypothetical protein VF590_18875, partial [Isosphaeraceae bacterium]